MENKLLERISFNPKIFGGKPIVGGRRLAVEHVLGMLGRGRQRRNHPGGLPLA